MIPSSPKGPPPKQTPASPPGSPNRANAQPGKRPPGPPPAKGPPPKKAAPPRGPPPNKPASPPPSSPSSPKAPPPKPSPPPPIATAEKKTPGGGGKPGGGPSPPGGAPPSKATAPSTPPGPSPKPAAPPVSPKGVPLGKAPPKSPPPGSPKGPPGKNGAPGAPPGSPPPRGGPPGSPPPKGPPPGAPPGSASPKGAPPGAPPGSPPPKAGPGPPGSPPPRSPPGSPPPKAPPGSPPPKAPPGSPPPQANAAGGGGGGGGGGGRGEKGGVEGGNGVSANANSSTAEGGAGGGEGGQVAAPTSPGGSTPGTTPRGAPRGRAPPPGAPTGRAPPPGAPKGRSPPQSPPPSGRPGPPSEKAPPPGPEAQTEAIDTDDDEDDVPPPPEGPPPEEGQEEEGEQLQKGANAEAKEQDALLEALAEMPQAELNADDRALITGGGGSVDGGGGGGIPIGDVPDYVRPGRLTVRCIQGMDIRKKTLNSKPATMDAYLKLTLGSQKKAPSGQTQVAKKSSAAPQFKNEEVVFDILDVSDFLDAKGDICLQVQVWDDNAWSDDLIASVKLSVLRFLESQSPTAEWLPLEMADDHKSAEDKERQEKNRKEGRGGDAIPSSSAKLQLELHFEETKVGMAVFKLFEGRALAGEEGSNMNPYVMFNMGEKYQKKSSTVKGGGMDPYFQEEDVLMWVDRTNWQHSVTLTVMSEDLGTDAVVGATTFSLLPFMQVAPDTAKETLLTLLPPGATSAEDKRGEVLLKVLFLPAGQLTVTVKSARRLREAVSSGRQDPYVQLKVDGNAMALTRKTHTDKDGGTEPVWNEALKMDVVDHYQLSIEVFHHDLISEDPLIGQALFSLLNVFRKGKVEQWVPLSLPSPFGAPKPAGEVFLALDFSAPPGVAYPQHRPGVDTFDEAQRVGSVLDMDNDVVAVKGDEKEDGEGGVLALASEAGGGGQTEDFDASEKAAVPKTDEFSDAEIEAAFRFLDLDNNSFIGAAELRHILICMGELITDEEVDMMIYMVDSDGDGQVSYEEFYALVTDPDPSRQDFNTAERIAGGVTGGLGEGAGASDRMAEMEARNAKKWLINEFVLENEIGVAELELSVDRYRKLVGSAKVDENGLVNFDAWVEVMNIEPTGQYRKLFKLYNVEEEDGGEDKIDMKEFLLGIGNYVDYPKEKRTQFIFELYDEDRSGFLSMNELVDVLKANHMMGAKSVIKKAQTIMRQADADGSGSLSFDEFVVVSKKFPNILFPSTSTAVAQ